MLTFFVGGSRGGGDRIVGIVIDSSLLLGLAASRPVILRRGDARAGLRSISLAWTLGGSGRGGRGVVAAIVTAAIVRARGSELGNGGTWECVGSIGEGVDEDTRVSVRVGTRETNEFIGTGGSGLAAADIDLDAAGVELGTSGLVGQMKGDDLVTKEVSTAGEVGRELE